MFWNLINALSEIHLLLTPDREHGKALEKIPVVGFPIVIPTEELKV